MRNNSKGDKVRPKVQWTAEDRARHRAIRDMFRDWHPSPEELIASGEGAHFDFHGEYRELRPFVEARGGGTHPGRGIRALWNRPAGPFSPGKRA